MTYAVFALTIVVMILFQEWWMQNKLKKLAANSQESVRWTAHYFIIPLVILVVLAGAGITQQRIKEVGENFKQSVAGLAPILSYELTQQQHFRVGQDTPADDPGYLGTINTMVQWMKLNPQIQSIYTLRKMPDGKNVFIVCPETDYDHNGVIEGEREERVAIGTEYADIIPEMEEAFKGKPTFEHQPSQDFWGTSITYYEPVYDSAGKAEAILGIDIDGQEWYNIVNREQYSIMVVVLAIVLIFSAFYQHLFNKKLKDIIERQRQAELAESELRFRGMAENSPVMMWLVDSDGRYRFLNKTWREFTGRSNDFLSEAEWEQMIHPEDCPVYAAKLADAFAVKGAFKLEFRIKSGTGEYCWVSSIGVPRWQGEEFLGFSGAAFDITERRLAEEQLKYLSFHDPLTGLYNRAFFEQEMQWLQGDWHGAVGVMVCDVDGLKLVNDILGHASGDLLLMKVAKLLKEGLQNENAVIARIGGDELAILLPGADGRKLEQIDHDILRALERYNLDYPEFPLSMSIGYSFAAGRPFDLNEVFKVADNNMYQVKKKNSRKKRDVILSALFKSSDEKEYAVFGRGDIMEEMVVAMAQQIGFSQQRINDLKILTRFHDIGEVGIPHHILFKAEPLTGNEMVEMRRHVEIGYRIARAIPQFAMMADYILKHHERWDGKGYPLGLENHEIPLECRILAIADTYAAMTTDRPYRKATSHLIAVAEIERNREKQFDPELVDVFVKLFGGRYVD